MRSAILGLAACIPIFASAQTTLPRRKVLTPEEFAYQQALKAHEAEIERLRAPANAAFAVEMAREKAPECPDATNTYDDNVCIAHENDLTDANYRAFTSALRAILALPSPDQPGVAVPAIGPSGPEATPATNTAAFDTAESAWHAYAKAECKAVDTFWRGGTIVNAIFMECNLRQSRNRLRELDTAYSGELHPH
jgi:uncharacterized protein YecT (DUF1311 family)